MKKNMVDKFKRKPVREEVRWRQDDELAGHRPTSFLSNVAHIEGNGAFVGQFPAADIWCSSEYLGQRGSECRTE